MSDPAAEPTPTNPAPADTSTAPTSVSTDVDLSRSTPAEPDPNAIDFTKVVPEAYKDKPYMKDVENIEQLFKKFDGAQQLLGKRPEGVPNEDAPQEEWDKFYNTMGRPEKAEDYQLADTKLPEGVKRSEGFVKAVKELAHKAGLSQKKFKEIQEGYDALLIEQLNEVKAQQLQQDTDFDKLGDDVFGTRKDTVLATANKLIKDHVPKELAPHIEQLSNENLMVLAGVLDSINTKYIQEDTPVPPGGDDVPSSIEARREEGRKLMASEAYTNPHHKDHAATVKRVRELYGTNQKTS